MSEKNTIKHDIEDAAVTIKRMSKGVQPVLERVVNYCSDSNADVATPKQMEILKRSLKAIEEESDKLIKLCDNLKEMKEQPHD